MVKNVFPERLKQAREKKGLSLRELRVRVRVSQSAMSHYANGVTLPTLDIAMKIAQELDVSVDWLCGNEKNGVTSLGSVARSIIDIWYYFPGTRLAAEDNIVSVLIKSEELYEFFRKAIELQKILNGEKESVYKMWETAELQTLDQLPFPECGFEIADEDIPF